MSSTRDIREGMQVYDSDDQLIGTVEWADEDGIQVNGQRIPLSAVRRLTQNRVYLQGASVEYGATTGTERGLGTEQAAGEIRVPVVEERLEVEKRAGQIGEVGIERRVVEEQQSVPVELRHEEVHVEQRDLADRPISPEEADRLFEEGTIRVPVHGEEAIVSKEARVTGEVVLTKEETTERQEIRDTVRRMEVEVDENYDRFRGGFQEHFSQTNTGGTRTWDEAEPSYRFGYAAVGDQRWAGRPFEEVEPELRRDWESRSGGGDTWERVRDGIREAWERARRR